MNIKLNRLVIENFKGIKSFEVELEGGNAVIKAENGIGKTTIYDAFLWLLFGKNSEGKKDFEVRPLDGSNQPIKGLVLAVEAELDCDGTIHTFRKEHHEKVVKKQLRGYETLCTIDEVPKKVGEYQDYITELIPEDTFKLLTDLSYFNSKLHWSDRRQVLLDIAGKIGTPEGFDELTAALNGRSVADYKKVLSEQKKRFENERDEINPRIDEIQKGLDEYAGTGTKKPKAQRDKIKAEIAKLDKQRTKLFATEKERQEKMDLIFELTKKRTQRESELANSTIGIKSLLDEKIKIEADVANKQQTVEGVKNDRKFQQTKLSGEKNQLDSLTTSISLAQSEYKTASEAPTDDACYACGQKLPADKLAGAEEKRVANLAKIARRGNGILVEVKACKKSIVEIEATIKELSELLAGAERGLQKVLKAKDKRTAEIDKLVEANQTIPPDSDKAWLVFDGQIKKTEAEIGEPVAEQMQTIEEQKTEKQTAVEKLNQALAQADRAKQDKTRIAELEAKEKELAQKIADIEKQLADIDQYKAVESRAIEEAVNGKFKHVTFKLFGELLNGGLEECCEAIFNGVPYSDMSTGQQIFVGIDIVNVLSAHYDVTVPMFIDHTESMTMPIEADTQTIKLFAKKGTKKLVVEKEGVPAHV